MTLAGSQAHFRFAFALAVLKSKPIGVSTEEYIISLRKSLLCQSESIPRTAAILDHAVLWHSLFLQAQRCSLDWRAKVTVLCDEDNAINEGPATSRKRAYQASSVVDKVNTQSKRRRTADTVGLEVEEEHLSTTEQHQDRTLLLRAVYSLARTKYKLPSDDERKGSITHLACNAIVETLQNAQDATDSKTASYSQPLTLNEACIAAKKIWSILLAKFHSSTRSSKEAEDHFSAVDYSLRLVVESFLDRLRQYCVEEADERLRSLRTSAKARDSSTKAALRNDLKRVELFKHNCGIVASTLAYLLALAANLLHNHLGLFEAVASVFLEHLGSAISLHLFGNPDGSDDGNTLAPPRGVHAVSHIGMKDAVLTTQLEAPYLVSILKKFMRCEALKDNTSMDKHAPDKLLKARLNPVVLYTLQSLLVRGIFDDDIAPNAESGGIGRPLLVVDGAEPQSNRDEGEKDQDWFLSQVWDLIGWDILLGMSDDMKLAVDSDKDADA